MNSNHPVLITLVTVPVDWEFKQESIIPENGPAEQQIAEESDGTDYFD